MAYPSFFDKVPTIKLFDPLARLLGACDDGIVEFGYPEIVRAAGHSCPTVASTFLMTGRALDALFPDQTPLRGGISVEFSGAQEDGVIGVVGAVVTQITGAAGPGGFKGLGGRFARRDLLHFGRRTGGFTARFGRVDGEGSVGVTVDPEVVPPNPETMPLMQKMLGGSADAGDRRRFTELWQDRVRRILIDDRDAPGLVVVTPDA